MKLRNLVIAALFGLASIGATAVPAQADLILYAETNYRIRFESRSSPGEWNMTPDNNDSLSSYRNETGMSAAFWREGEFRGVCWSAKPRENNPQFYWWDDNQVSSYALGRAC